MKTVCSIPVTNVLECRQEEETKGWKITNRYEFDLLGIKNIKTFHTKDIVAKKYYEVRIILMTNSVILHQNKEDYYIDEKKHLIIVILENRS